MYLAIKACKQLFYSWSIAGTALTYATPSYFSSACNGPAYVHKEFMVLRLSVIKVCQTSDDLL